jgi:hypothetical protein
MLALGPPVLVRPDGFVAWTADTMTADPTATLGAAVRRMLAA